MEGERGGWWRQLLVTFASFYPCLDAGLPPSWCKSAGICIAGSNEARQAPHSPTAPLRFPASAGDMAHEEALPRRKHRHIVLKMPILSPQGQRGEETSMCLCHLSGKAFLLLLVYTYWVWNGLAIFFCSFTHRPVGRRRSGSGRLQLMLSRCLMPCWVELGRSLAAATWAVTGQNSPASLQSGEPTSMQPLCFLNTYF